MPSSTTIPYDPKSKPYATKKSKPSRNVPWRFLLLMVSCVMATSYLTTGNIFFGYVVPYRKLIHQLIHKELTFTPEELRQYDGTDPEKPIYLAVLGRVYDVSAGISHYGPGGSYHFFAGRDAGRAFATGCFETHLIPDLRGLTSSQVEQIRQWQSFYETSNKYFYIGKVLHPPIDPDSPLPEPCEKAKGGGDPNKVFKTEKEGQ